MIIAYLTRCLQLRSMFYFCHSNINKSTYDQHFILRLDVSILTIHTYSRPRMCMLTRGDRHKGCV